MSNKLTVNQLRSQLSQRGPDSSGTKPLLVQRLDSALLIENKADETNELVVNNKKRRRESKEEDEDLIANDLEKLNQFSIKQLREQAALRGVSVNGSKKQLLERISAHHSLAKEEDVGGGDKNLVKVTKRGGDILDQEVTSEDGGVKKVEDVEELCEMGIRQLREQAALHGFLTSGTKKQLLERLCAHSLSEAEENAEKADAGTKNKLVKANKKGGAVLDQKLLSEDGGMNVTDKVEDVDKLCEMGICQLREQATCRGISADGSKKQLLERLCADSVNEPAKDEVKKEKLVKATKKGGAVLDQWLPDRIKTQYHVLQNGEEIYDAMLNQTNVGGNNNKFYMIQALESDDGRTFMVYNRWGRVGVKGQDKLHGPYTSRDSAITEFELKFNAKTKNEWSDRKNFVCKPKCYAWLEMDYSETENNSIVAEKPNHSIQPRETKLEPRIAKFISLICNVSMMKQQMMEIGYNAEKLPLGKLSKSTILKGYGVLKRISEVISQSNRKILEELSGEFYTVIPHDFGFKKMSEFVIDTPHKLKLKLQMVEALGEIEVATKLLSDGIEMQEDPLYSHYQHLSCDLTAVDIHSEEHSMIERYMRNTHASTHSNYSVDIVQIFRISRHGETERFKKYFSTKNRMLLWHGSRLTNWTGILSQGLRIAPPEAPSTGYMFGKGVYFADMFSKSANYCYSSKSSSSGVLLLCEVALGDVEEYTNANYDADKLPKGKLSTKGVGTTAPDPLEYKALEDGVVVPLGKPKPQTGKQGGGGLLYNEFIVYNVDQIRMRYVIQVNFNFKRSY